MRPGRAVSRHGEWKLAASEWNARSVFRLYGDMDFLG
jgi:hypothetical protein